MISGSNGRPRDVAEDAAAFATELWYPWSSCDASREVGAECVGCGDAPEGAESPPPPPPPESLHTSASLAAHPSHSRSLSAHRNLHPAFSASTLPMSSTPCALPASPSVAVHALLREPAAVLGPVVPRDGRGGGGGGGARDGRRRVHRGRSPGGCESLMTRVRVEIVSSRSVRRSKKAHEWWRKSGELHPGAEPRPGRAACVPCC